MVADPSVYSQIGAGVPPIANPLAMQAQTANTANALLGVKAQMAKQAAGQAFQQSINPDGSTNQPQLLQNLASNPQAAMAAQESAQAGQTLSTSEYAQHMARLNYGASGAAQLLTSPGGPTLEAVKSYYDKAVQDGHVTPQDEASVLAGFGQDPAANAALIKQRLAQNIGAQGALTAALPVGGLQDIGPGLQPTLTSPALGPNPNLVAPAGSMITKATGPDQNAALQEVTMEDPAHPGTYIKVLRPRSTLPGASGVTGGPQPSPPGQPMSGNGAYKPAPAQSQTAPAPGGITPAPTSAATPVPTAQQGSAAPLTLASAPQGQPANLEADQTAYNQAKAAVPGSVKDAVNLNHALDALKVLQTSTLGTGQGSEGMHNIFSYLQTVGALPAGLTDNVANYELAKKALVNFAASQAGSAHTDLGLTTSAAGNPSVDGMSNQAAQTVVKQRLGVINKSIAQVNEAPSASGNGYLGHSSTFSQTMDDRAFAFDTYTPKEQADIVKSLGPRTSDKYKAFAASLMTARKNNFISPPSQPAAATAPSSQPAVQSAQTTGTTPQGY